MKDLIKKILNKQVLEYAEIFTFISDYCELMKVKTPTREEMDAIVLLLQNRIFDVEYAAKQAATALNLQLCTLTDKNNNLIIVYIQE